MRSVSGILLKCAAFGAFTYPLPVSSFSAAGYRLSFANHQASKSSVKASMSTHHPLQTEPSTADVTWACDPSIRIVLGSQSATRRQILKEMKVDFEAISPNIDEKAIRFDCPENLVLALAHAKASALLQDKRVVNTDTGKTTLLLTCDQVVVHEGKILEKPESPQQAAEFIRTVGATVVTNLRTGQRHEAVDIAKIFFRPFPEEVIADIVAEGQVMYCAGGLMVEADKVQPYLQRIEGGVDAVMGLSKRTVARLLSLALAA